MRTAAEYRELAHRFDQWHRGKRIEPEDFADEVWAALHDPVKCIWCAFVAALREAAEMVRDHEAMEKLRADRIGDLLWTYNLDLWQVEPHERGTYADPVDAILGGEPHEEM